MVKYLTNFKKHSDYNTYITSQDKILPNLSYCELENEVHFNPWVETRIVGKFNVTSTSEATSIMYNDATYQFSEIEIDGVVQPSVVSSYTFDTIGEHIVKYTLTDPTAIYSDAFKGCTGLTSVTIGNSVTSIGINAFVNCSGLTSVTISNSVTSIGGSAFYGTNLIRVNSNVEGECILPNNITVLGIGCFSATRFTNIVIPNSVAIIENGAFQGCSYLENVIIGSGVTSIGFSVFAQCTSLASVTVQATTPPTLNNGAFNDNATGRKIYVPSGSVATYKAASVWSDYASDIEAIS